MKTIILITTIISFQISSIFAENTVDPNLGHTNTEEACIECPFLSPIIPTEASYEDQKDVTILMEEDALVPEIPMEADFADEFSAISPDTLDLSLEVPQEADFSTAL